MRFDPTGRPPHELGPSFVPWLNVQNAPFRARGDGSAHDKAAINNAIEEMAAIVSATLGAETFGGGRVFLPRGHYSVDDITLRYGVRLCGDGAQSTKLVARSGSTAAGLVLLDTGIVAYSSIEHMTLVGDPGNTDQAGILIEAVATTQVGATQGGWWNSAIRHVVVGGFDGDGIWLHGGDDSFQNPIQFISLDHVEVDCPSTTSHALRMSGQVDHIKCLGACRFDGPGFGAGGTNILLERTVDSSGANNGDNAPHDIELIGMTTQSNSLGVEVQRAQNVWVMHNHFESLHNGVLVNTSAKNVVVADNDFANTGHDGSGTGYIVKVTNANVTVRDNYFAYGTSGGFGQPDSHYNRAGGGLLNIEGTYHRDDNGIKTVAAFLQINAASTIDVTGFNHVLVNTSGTAITTITSNYSVPGNTLAIKAHNGSIVLNSGGNIYFDSSPNRYKAPLVVPADTMVFLIRMNLSGSEIWYIVAGAENANYVRAFGCNGALPQGSASVPAPPSTGGTGVTAGAFDSAGHRDALISSVSAIRAALVANGIVA